jgi:small-conductance mechanosensitive channel
LARSKRKAFFSRSGALFVFAVGLTTSLWSSAQPTASESTRIVDHLNQAISWYRRVATLDVAAGQSSDTLYLENARSSAAQALQLAFQSASAQAALIARAGKANVAPAENSDDNTPQPPDQQQSLAKAAARIGDRIKQEQMQIDDLGDQIDKSSGKKRQQLISQRDALQGELDLEKTIQETILRITSVGTGEANGNGGLAAQIAQLKQSVPEVFASAKKEGSAPAGQTSKASSAEGSGLFGQTSVLFSQMRDIHEIDQLISETVRLRNTAEKLNLPLRDFLKGLVQQGRNIVNDPATSDPTQIAATRKQFAALTSQFKQTADAAVPLRQEIILLDQCHGELLEWRNSITAEYKRVLRSLLMRVGGVLITLLLVFGLSHLWRRATYRYIKDARRRRQLTLIRRFVIGFMMGLVIIGGFISEFSSLATFAGFLTAGIAVALQTIILSIAAYFFLVGRYGVRVGDRITVSGVTGDVVEVGLIRLYLMELSGTGIDLYPTGRVVVFSNSVMFQAAPFFKQLPGTAYAWHEVAVMLAPGADAARAEQKLLEAVNSVYGEYQHSIDRQHALVERILDTSVAAPAPKSHLHFIDAGLELSVRFPVEIPHASETDDKVTRRLMQVISSDAELKAAVTGSPTLRAPIKA